jgi:hypothetical protein
MIDTGRKQKPIISVQAFVVCGIPPRLAVTGPQVRGIVNARNAAESLNRHHPLLEETLASPSGDDRLSFGSGILMSRSTSDSMWCSHSSKSALATVMLLSAWIAFAWTAIASGPISAMSAPAKPSETLVREID